MDLEFTCLGAEPDRQAASPTLLLRLEVTETTGTAIHALVLRCQIRIEPQRRRYDDAEAEALLDLFGDRPRWSQTLRPLRLAFATAVLPGFTGSTPAALPVACTYDFDVVAAKYLYALDTGEVPMLLLFNGTAFTGSPGTLSVQPIAWNKEARFRLPVETWRQVMELHFPGTAWLRLGRETFDALHRYRVRHSLLTWDGAVQQLLKERAEDG